jgi:hypothetical protein
VRVADAAEKYIAGSPAETFSGRLPNAGAIRRGFLWILHVRGPGRRGRHPAIQQVRRPHLAGGTRIPGYPQAGSATIAAHALCECWFEVRFGTDEGERRAYLTLDYGHSNRGSLIRLDLENSRLVMSETTTYPPGTFTLSGVITERTPTGPAPLEGATIYRAYAVAGRMPLPIGPVSIRFTASTPVPIKCRSPRMAMSRRKAR